MHGSLALKSGVLYVCRGDSPSSIRPYDLDGRALGEGFSIPRVGESPAAIRGFSVDEDHRIWIADRGAERLRAFTLTGQELAGLVGSARDGVDVAGSIGDVVHVAATGVEDSARLCVASGGRRRHALQVFDPRSGRVMSMRSGGDPTALFRGLVRVAVRERLTFAVEPGAERVQVFRDAEFHFALRVESSSGRGHPFDPRAVAALGDGRLLVAHGGTETSGLWLVDHSARILRVLAECGTETGQVIEPTDVVVEESTTERESRVAVIDRDGDRVQVFTLDGRCYGSFWDVPAASS